MQESKALYDIAAEASVIGSILIDEDVRFEKMANGAAVFDAIKAPMFYQQRHCFMWEGIIELIGKRITPDIVTLTSWLNENRGDPDVIWEQIVVNAVNTPATPTAIASYAEVVRSFFVRRKARKAAEIMASFAYDYDDPSDLASQLETSHRELMEHFNGHENDDSIFAAVSRYNDEVSHKKDFTKLISLGIDPLTDHVGPEKGWVFVLGARPNVGKTWVMCKSIIDNCLAGISVGVISLDSHELPLIDRLIALYGGLDSVRVRDFRRKRLALRSDELERFETAVEEIKRWPMRLYTDPVTVSRLSSLCRNWKRDGMDVLYVDYLQQIVASGRNREQEVSEISRTIKSLSRELGFFSFIIAQLSRATEMRGDKRPILSDLRDSGQIEQDGDAIVFMYDDSKYNGGLGDPGMEFNLAKFKHGALSSYTVPWSPGKAIIGKQVSYAPTVKQTPRGRASHEVDLATLFPKGQLA